MWGHVNAYAYADEWGVLGGSISVRYRVDIGFP